MFGWFKRFIIKRAIPEIIEGFELRVRTVHYKQGKMLTFYAEVLGYTILDRKKPVSEISGRIGEINITIKGGE